MFPNDFLWGAATSSHQVEGLNSNNDWWQWEQIAKIKEKSGKACNHYELYKQDFDLAKQLNHNCHRFSIEWSRIQPQQDVWLDKEIAHYLVVIEALRERGLEPIVTLHHFTNPLWLSRKGGWLNKDIIKYFKDYTEKVVQALAKKVNFWITINEPLVYAYYAYLEGIWPPGECSLNKFITVVKNLILCHKESYKSIHQIYKNNGLSKPMISIAKHFRKFSECNLGNKILNRFSRALREKYFNYYFLDKIKGHLDFIGLNYYTREFVSFSGFNPKGIFGKNCDIIHNHSRRRNILGWEFYPQGLFDILIRLKDYKLPILITENGTAEDDDERRYIFILEHLKQIEKALKLNIPIIGYLYWSLLDNFEWDKGFSPRFGLIEVNYKTFERKVRESAIKFANICNNNSLK